MITENEDKQSLEKIHTFHLKGDDHKDKVIIPKLDTSPISLRKLDMKEFHREQDVNF